MGAYNGLRDRLQATYLLTPPVIRKSRENEPYFKESHSKSLWSSQVVLMVKNLPANAGDIRDVSLTPGSGSSPGEGNGNPLQYYCLENPMDRGAWLATVHAVAKSQT